MTHVQAAGAVGAPSTSGARLRVGRLWIDALTRAQAIAAVDALVARGTGGAVFTPNVDHVVLADERADFRAAYDDADLVFADGVPVVWASRLLGLRLPEKLSGSDLFLPIARLAAARGWRVYLLGGGPGAAVATARRLEAEGVTVVGVDDGVVAPGPDPRDAAVLARVRAARPDVVFVGLGTPKGELFIGRARAALAPAVCMGVGATFDFVAGRVRRCPPWVSRAGLEWAYRLGREPRRLWRRYLLRDPQFLLILLRSLRRPRVERVQPARA